jgi:hypothetical protein
MRADKLPNPETFISGKARPKRQDRAELNRNLHFLAATWGAKKAS